MQKNVIKNDLFDYKNRYIFQIEKSFKFSLDSVLLSEYIKVTNQKEIICDFCMGLAPIPLILSTKYKNKIVGIELQKEIYDLSKKSIEYNKLNEQIKVINDDINNVNKYFKNQSVDIITCNPPFFNVNDKSIINEDEITKISRHEVKLKLEDIFKMSSIILKDNGKLYMVHRPDRIDEIILLANMYNMNVKEIINVITNDKLGIKTILVKCVKNSQKGVKIKAINICGRKTYKDIFKEVL